jgi:hypothetical protein
MMPNAVKRRLSNWARNRAALATLICLLLGYYYLTPFFQEMFTALLKSRFLAQMISYALLILIIGLLYVSFYVILLEHAQKSYMRNPS